MAITETPIEERIYYLGNTNLKGVGAKVKFTEEELEDFIQCSMDPVHFIKKHCKIISLDYGLVPFNLYEYQVKFIQEMHENRKVISMQPRQMGKTQTVAAYLLWYTIFKPAMTVAILANKGAAAREILDRYQEMYEGIPYHLQQGIKVWNKGNITLENKSKIFTGATTAAGIRGKSVNFVYIDEAAIIPNNVAEAFFAATYPTISSGKTTKVVLTSTPLGYNHFWKFWNEALNDINGFRAYEVKYYDHPNRDLAWATEQKKMLGELKYNQEVLCAFLGSSNTLIDPGAIAKMSAIYPIHSIKEGSNAGLDLYESAIKGERPHAYVITVDTSKGVGGDYSAFSLFDVTTTPYKLVGKYRNNKIAPLLFPNIINKVAREYNDASVLFEINSSEQVPHILHYELEYDNILYVSPTKNGQAVSGGFGSPRLGLNMDRKTKRIGCSNLKSLIEEGKLLVFDQDLIAEFSTFIQVKDSFAADEGYHDDLVMTLVIFAWLTTQSYFTDLTDINLRRELYRNQMEAIDQEQLPAGFFNDGIPGETVGVLNF
jgi:hypothetical protein